MSHALERMSTRLDLRARMDLERGTRHAVDMVDDRIARALATMKADPARRWTVASLARVAGLSRAAFARRFVEVTKMSPVRWLTQHRLEVAQVRLVTTDDGLAVIAAEVGYATEFAFAKAFKRLVGVAPGTFRRAVRSAVPRSTIHASTAFRVAA